MSLRRERIELGRELGGSHRSLPPPAALVLGTGIPGPPDEGHRQPRLRSREFRIVLQRSSEGVHGRIDSLFTDLREPRPPFQVLLVRGGIRRELPAQAIAFPGVQAHFEHSHNLLRNRLFELQQPVARDVDCFVPLVGAASVLTSLRSTT